MSQAMAAYIRQQNFDTIHLHDYHVGLVPFFLGDECLREVPIHFTIHNASYQGEVPLRGGGYETLESLNLPGERLFHKYFDFFDYVNLMKACMLVVHENGGKITTVSGDLKASWGYAAELRENEPSIRRRALAQKGRPPRQVFLPNRHLDLSEKLPVIGITNGMSNVNRPENLPELKADCLRQHQERNPHKPLFSNPTVQSEMLARDHNFDVDNLEIKAGLKRMLHLEAFDYEASDDPIIFTFVGRLVDQKNPLAVCDIIERVLAYDSRTRFVIIAAAPDGDPEGKAAEARFASLARQHRGRLHLDNSFNIPMAKLTLAGGDFALIPSKFEPCGLVDYEASLVGNVVIGRLTGGLAKVRHCAYLYDWLDTGDRAGESHAFFQKIREAIDVYRHNAPAHMELVKRAMAINSSWDSSASQYIEMYRYGLLAKKWQAERHKLIEKFARTLKKERELFDNFFVPGEKEYSDWFNWELKDFL
jgi:glycogen synthase